jgi:hypothetical protein
MQSAPRGDVTCDVIIGGCDVIIGGQPDATSPEQMVLPAGFRSGSTFVAKATSYTIVQLAM